MLKRLADWLSRRAYGETWAEMLRREWLEKGYARGNSAPRQDCPFGLFLHRSDVTDASRATQVGVAANTLPYMWWGVFLGPGGNPVLERPLGTLDALNFYSAVCKYLEMLREIEMDFPNREVLDRLKLYKF